MMISTITGDINTDKYGDVIFSGGDVKTTSSQDEIALINASHRIMSGAGDMIKYPLYGANLHQLEKLLLLKERWDAAQAKKSFLAAISRFQSQIPVIQKKKQVGYTGKSGQLVGYKYAELSEIDDAIKGPMLANGLSKRWELGEDAENIICTCIIIPLSYHYECVGAFCYYSRKAIFEVGLMDTHFHNAFEHVVHTC